MLSSPLHGPSLSECVRVCACVRCALQYEVLIHTKAYASNEWRGATPWAPPTSAVIPPEGKVTYGVRLRLARDVEGVNDALLSAGLPVAVPLPAATLHADMLNAKLQVLTPPSLLLIGKRAEPAGCLEVGSFTVPYGAGHGSNPTTMLQTVPLRPNDQRIGGCRVVLSYRRVEEPAGSEMKQYIHLRVLDPAAALLQRHGDFAATKGWLPANTSDPWHRGPRAGPWPRRGCRAR